jgi:predicted O-methyltransferase YrrM
VDPVGTTFRLAERCFPGGIVQIESEVTGFLDFISPLKPEVFLEVGSGTSANSFVTAQSVPTIRKMVCVDMHIRNRRRLSNLIRQDVELNLINGDSHAETTRNTVKACLGGQCVDVLFIDGDHTFRGVFEDFLQYGQLVRDGGVIAFHDIVPDPWCRMGGRSSSAYTGEVPIVWSLLKSRYKSLELVEDFAQDGFGIGVLTYDGGIHMRPIDLVS